MTKIITTISLLFVTMLFAAPAYVHAQSIIKIMDKAARERERERKEEERKQKAQERKDAVAAKKEQTDSIKAVKNAIRAESQAKYEAQTRKLDLEGVYKGYLKDYNNQRSWAYTLQVEAKEKGVGRYKATGTLEMDGKTASFQMLVIEDFKGGNRLYKMEFYDESTTTAGNWCRKYFRGDQIEVWDDSLIIGGSWSIPGDVVFKDGKVMKDSTQNCPVGTFRLAKATDNSSFSYATKRSSKGCISGNCQNGVGEFLDYTGTYKGSFVNGVRQGQGEYIFTSGPRKNVVYKGSFTNNDFNGNGKITYPVNTSGLSYYEGGFINGEKNGQGENVYIDGAIFRGNFSNGQPWGLGKRIKGKISNLGYWEYDGPSSTQGLSLNVLKNHQDTVFAKFKKCTCLTKHKFVIPSWHYEDVKYDHIDAYTGEKLYSSTNSELMLNGLPVQGYINNTGSDIYIRGYLKVFFKERNIYEYIDESFTVKPGEMVMANYRRQPVPGELYNLFFNQEFILVGQYCDKSAAVCK